MSELALTYLCLPPICIAFVLLVITMALGGACWHRTRIYALASLGLAAVFLVDLLLNMIALTTRAFAPENSEGHALLFIPMMATEVFISTAVALYLFHRQTLIRYLSYVGFAPIAPWIFVNIGISLVEIGKYGSWTAALNHLAITHYGQTLLLILPTLFMATIIGSYATIIAGIVTYSRQIRSYFSFHEHRPMSVLTLSAVAYLIYMAATSVAMIRFFSFGTAATNILPFAAIYTKSAFFIFFTYLLIRFKHRYKSISPALEAIEEIEAAVGAPTDEESNSAANESQEAAYISKERTKQQKALSAAPDEPMMRQLLEQWSSDPKKFYLRDDINLLQVAEMIGVRPRFLSEYLNIMWGVNFNQFINKLRIEEAKKLIREDKSRQITDIAYATGYSSVATFSKVFKRVEGISPTTFRENHLA